jgi:hypothetical protein
MLKRICRSLERFRVVENLVARPHPDHVGQFEVLSGNHRLGLLQEVLSEISAAEVSEFPAGRGQAGVEREQRQAGVEPEQRRRFYALRSAASCSRT